jgi:hypothetical protein
VITEATEPVVEESSGDGGVVLRAQLAPVPELAKLGDIPSVDVFLQLDADHHPVEARFTATEGTASADVTITFSGWSNDVVIDPPADGEIDHTPWVTEEDLAAASPSLLLVPTAVPAPMQLVSAMAFDGGMYEGFTSEGESESGSCTTVSFTYGTEAGIFSEAEAMEMTEEDFDDLEYLDVSIADLSCGGDEAMYDESYFDDELAGHPATGGDGYWEIEVGDGVVTVSGSLEEDAVGGLVDSLRPTSVEAIVAAIPAWVAENADEIGGFGMFPMGGMGASFAFG